MCYHLCFHIYIYIYITYTEIEEHNYNDEGLGKKCELYGCYNTSSRG